MVSKSMLAVALGGGALIFAFLGDIILIGSWAEAEKQKRNPPGKQCGEVCDAWMEMANVYVWAQTLAIGAVFASFLGNKDNGSAQKHWTAAGLWGAASMFVWAGIFPKFWICNANGCVNITDFKQIFYNCGKGYNKCCPDPMKDGLGFWVWSCQTPCCGDCKSGSAPHGGLNLPGGLPGKGHHSHPMEEAPPVFPGGGNPFGGGGNPFGGGGGNPFGGMGGLGGMGGHAGGMGGLGGMGGHAVGMGGLGGHGGGMGDLGGMGGGYGMAMAGSMGDSDMGDLPGTGFAGLFASFLQVADSAGRGAHPILPVITAKHPCTGPNSLAFIFTLMLFPAAMILEILAALSADKSSQTGYGSWKKMPVDNESLNDDVDYV